MRNWLQWIARQERNWANVQSGTDRGLNLSACDEEPDPLILQRLLSLFVALGILARAIRYYLCFPLWDDESFLCVNFIGRTYAELLQPLDYHQVAPILFLWIERTVVNLLGYSEYTLRLVPFACSIASLFLFRRVARQLLSGRELLFAVAIFAVSYPGIRYGAEAKQYAFDLFVPLVLLALVVEWVQRRKSWLLAVLAALMPVALGASYPAVFAAGGFSLVVGGVLLKQHGTRGEWYGWFTWNIAIVVSFAGWFYTAGRVQSGAEAEFMGTYWKENFPPIGQPWQLPFWLLQTHASDFLAYPIGGPNWASTATMILCCVGLAHLVRHRQFLMLGLIVGPAGLHFLAAAMQRYPYGGHVKFSHYLAPMICCVTAIGAVRLMSWRAADAKFAERRFAGAGLILLLLGTGGIIRDLANPFKTRSDFRARAFAQAFWVGAHSAEEVYCLKSDLGLDFVPDQHRELSWSAHYRCNQAIEVSRSHLSCADLNRVSTERPLRCVLYRDARYQFDQARFDEWLSQMQEHYELIAHESLPFPRMAKDDRRLVTMEYVDSYKFVPRQGTTPLADSQQFLKP